MSRKPIELSIVIPVYFEGDSIEKQLEMVETHVSGQSHEVLVVYDVPEDTTIPVVQRYIEKTKANHIRLIQNDIIRGPSGALRTGFREAKGSIVLVTMADLSDDLSQIPKMCEYMREGYDLVVPSRYCPGGVQKRKGIKAFVPRLAGRILKNVTGFPVYDATNSYRMYSKEVLTSFPIKSTHSFSVTLEVTAKAHCLGYRMKEMPTTWVDRGTGKSKFPFFASLFSYLPWFFLAALRLHKIFPAISRSLVLKDQA